MMQRLAALPALAQRRPALAAIVLGLVAACAYPPLHLWPLGLAALAASNLVDSPGEERFDRIVRLASMVTDSPIALISQTVPDLVERDAPDLIAVSAEGVNVAVTQLAPIDELNAKLEAALDSGEQLTLVNLEQLVELYEGWYGRFAHPNGADGFGLD